MAGPRSIINPLNNPYFGSSGGGSRGETNGDGTRSYYGTGTSLGSADGSGLFNIETLPDYLSFAPGYGQQLNGDSSANPNAINPQAFADYLQQRGYTAYDEANDRNGGVRGVQDAQGNIIGTPMEYTNNDNAFWNAALLAGGITGANILGAGAGFGGFTGGGGAGGLTAAEAAAAADYAAIQAGANAGQIAGATAGTGATVGSGGGGWGSTALSSADKAALYGAEGYGALASPAELAFKGGGQSLFGGGMGDGFLGISNGQWLNTGLNVANGLIGANSARRAGDAINAAGAQSNALQREMFDYQKGLNEPLVGLRNSVLPQIQSLLQNPGSITSQPGYQFGLQEGTNALNTGAASRGMTYSGNQGKALQRYGQDYAGTKLDQSLNRLTNVAGLGQVGATNNQNASANYGTNVGNSLQQMGNVRGSSYMGQASAITGSIGNIANNWQQQNLLRQLGYPVGD